MARPSGTAPSRRSDASASDTSTPLWRRLGTRKVVAALALLTLCACSCMVSAIFAPADRQRTPDEPIAGVATPMLEPTATSSPSPSPSPTLSPTPSPTLTPSPTPSPMLTPTPTPSPPPTSTPTPVATPTDAVPAIRTSSAHVLDVIDGDTVSVRLGNATERVRMIGVDAPESTREVEFYGKEAAAFTTRNLAGRTVYLEFDVGNRDRFGRLLAYVWLAPPVTGSETEARASMHNARLLLAGYAQTLTIPPNVRYAELFTRFQREAREAGAGLWGAAPQPSPATGAQAAYVGNRNTLRFHVATCRWVAEMSPANRVEFRTREEALAAGYTPCRVCDP